jgi:hypothetical protein
MKETTQNKMVQPYSGRHQEERAQRKLKSKECKKIKGSGDLSADRYKMEMIKKKKIFTGPHRI